MLCIMMTRNQNGGMEPSITNEIIGKEITVMLNQYHLKFRLLIITCASLVFCYPVSSQEPDDKIKIDYSQWAAFASNLELCSLSKFVLPDPTKVTQLRQRLAKVTTEGPDVAEKLRQQLFDATTTYEIFGWKDQQCQVSITDKIIDPTLPPTPGPNGFDCSFSKLDVEKLVISAKKIAAGNLPLTWTDPDVNLKGMACKSKIKSIPPLQPPPERNF